MSIDIQRAYAQFQVKSLSDDGEMVIRGLATSPVPDRANDIVEPLGIKFQNPMPFLWQHAHDKPIGTVEFDKPTKSGVTFTARIPKIDEPGHLKDLIDMARQSIRAGLVRGVSIGFRALERAFLDNGGVHFLKSEVYELSAVTVPMHQLATIDTIRSLDQWKSVIHLIDHKTLPPVGIPLLQAKR